MTLNGRYATYPIGQHQFYPPKGHWYLHNSNGDKEMALCGCFCAAVQSMPHGIQNPQRQFRLDTPLLEDFRSGVTTSSEKACGAAVGNLSCESSCQKTPRMQQKFLKFPLSSNSSERQRITVAVAWIQSDTNAVHTCVSTRQVSDGCAARLADRKTWYPIQKLCRYLCPKEGKVALAN